MSIGGYVERHRGCSSRCYFLLSLKLAGCFAVRVCGFVCQPAEAPLRQSLVGWGVEGSGGSMVDGRVSERQQPAGEVRRDILRELGETVGFVPLP